MRVFSIVLIILATCCLVACESQYDKGYKEGYESGYMNGRHDGYIAGEKDGYQSGYIDGTVKVVGEDGLPSIGMSIIYSVSLFSFGATIYFLYNNFKRPVKSKLDEWVDKCNERWHLTRLKGELVRYEKASKEYSRIKAKALTQQTLSKFSQALANISINNQLYIFKENIIDEIVRTQQGSSDEFVSYLRSLINETENTQHLHSREKIDLYQSIRGLIEDRSE